MTQTPTFVPPCAESRSTGRIAVEALRSDQNIDGPFEKFSCVTSQRATEVLPQLSDLGGFLSARARGEFLQPCRVSEGKGTTSLRSAAVRGSVLRALMCARPPTQTRHFHSECQSRHLKTCINQSAAAKLPGRRNRLILGWIITYNCTCCNNSNSLI